MFFIGKPIKLPFIKVLGQNIIQHITNFSDIPLEYIIAHASKKEKENEYVFSVWPSPTDRQAENDLCLTYPGTGHSRSNTGRL